MIHLQADITQNQQLLERGIIIAPVAISRILKKHSVPQAVVDDKYSGHNSVRKAGYVIVTNLHDTNALMRISFVGHPIPVNWQNFKDDLKTMGIHYTHPNNDDKRRILDITTKSVIVANDKK